MDTEVEEKSYNDGKKLRVDDERLNVIAFFRETATSQTRNAAPHVRNRLVQYDSLDAMTKEANPVAYALQNTIAQYASHSEVPHKPLIQDAVDWLQGKSSSLILPYNRENGRTTKRGKRRKGKRTESETRRSDFKFADGIRRLIELSETAILFKGLGSEFMQKIAQHDSTIYDKLRRDLQYAVQEGIDLDSILHTKGSNRKAFFLNEIHRRDIARRINSAAASLSDNIRTAITNADGEIDVALVVGLLTSSDFSIGNSDELGLRFILKQLNLVNVQGAREVLNKAPRYNLSLQEKWRQQGVRVGERGEAKVKGPRLLPWFDLPQAQSDPITLDYIRSNYANGRDLLYQLRLPSGGIRVLRFNSEYGTETIHDVVWTFIKDNNILTACETTDRRLPCKLSSFDAISQIIGLAQNEYGETEGRHKFVVDNLNSALRYFDSWVDPKDRVSLAGYAMPVEYGINGAEFHRVGTGVVDGFVMWAGYKLPFKIEEGAIHLPAGLKDYAFAFLEMAITMHLAKYQAGYVEANYQYVEDLRAEGKTIDDMENVDRLLRMTMTQELVEAMEARKGELLPYALSGLQSVKGSVTSILTASESEEFKQGVNLIQYNQSEPGKIEGFVNFLGKQIAFVINTEGVSFDTSNLSDESKINLGYTIIHYLAEFRKSNGSFANLDENLNTDVLTEDDARKIIATEDGKQDIARITHMRSMPIGHIPESTRLISQKNPDKSEETVTANEVAEEHFGYTVDTINKAVVDTLRGAVVEDEVLAWFAQNIVERIRSKTGWEFEEIVVDGEDGHQYITATRYDRDGQQQKPVYSPRFEDYMHHIGCDDACIEDFKNKGCPPAFATVVAAVGRWPHRLVYKIPPRPEVEAPSLTPDNPQPHVPRG